MTLVYNPLIGFISSAYSARVSPTIAISSRFGVNVYSYESDLSIGGEWWIGRRRGKRDVSHDEVPEARPTIEEMERVRSRKAALSETSLREDGYEDEQAEARLDSPILLTRDIAHSPQKSSSTDVNSPMGVEERDGVLKARVSGNGVRSESSVSRIVGFR